MTPRRWKLELLDGRFAVCRLRADAEVPPWTQVGPGTLVSVTRTPDELSLVVPEAAVPEGVQAEKDFVCLRIVGPLEFVLVGVLAEISGVLARAGVSVFVLSTFDTDYVLARSVDCAEAVGALRAAGHEVVE